MRLILLLSVISIIALAGCISSSNESTESAAPPTSKVSPIIPLLPRPERIVVTSDKCSDVYDSTSLLKEEIETIVECYKNKYFRRAVEQNSTEPCDEICMAWALGRCYGKIAFERDDLTICEKVDKKSYTAQAYYDNLTTTDICYTVYIDNYLEKLILKEELISKLSNEQMKGGYNKFSEHIKPPVAFNTVYAEKVSDLITGIYFTLANEVGDTATGDGTITLKIIEGRWIYTKKQWIENKTKTMYTTSFEVKKEEFELTTVGRGSFAHPEIICRLDNIQISDFSSPPEKDAAYKMILEFETEDGNTFSSEKSLLLT